MELKTKDGIFLTIDLTDSKATISGFKAVRIISEGSVLDKKNNPTLHREITSVVIDGLFFWKGGDLNCDLYLHESFLEMEYRRTITKIEKIKNGDNIEIYYEKTFIKSHPNYEANLNQEKTNTLKKDTSQKSLF